MRVYATSHIHSLTVCKAFAQGSGLPLVGVENGLLAGGIVTYGNLRGLKPILDRAIREGREWIYADNGYLRPGHYNGFYRLTRGSYQHDGSGQATSERWGRLDKRIERWRPSGSFVMVCPPSALYASLRGFDADLWLVDTLSKLTAATDRRIEIRRKPKNGVGVALRESLQGCHAVVTHSSNSAVEALLYGFPVFCTHPCAAYVLGEPDVGRIESPRFPEREQWAWNIAAAQWTLSEMRDGTCWRELNGDSLWRGSTASAQSRSN